MTNEEYSETILISDKVLLRLRKAQDIFLAKLGVYPSYSKVIEILLGGWGL